MHILTSKRAISSLILIILILCSIVFGAIISYLWVMASYYHQPENMISLVITDVNFQVDKASYFNLTIMNPSNSISGANITRIYFTVEEDSNIYDVTTTEPAFPIRVERASTKTIKCLRNWGAFAGKTITVHVSAIDASGAEKSFKTSFVSMEVTPKFNPTISCTHFNLTVSNLLQSVINLTIKRIYFNLIPLDNATILRDGQNVTLPFKLAIGESVSLQLFHNWEYYKDPTVRVDTSEGYYYEARANATATTLLTIDNVVFNENKADADEFSLTISNSEESSTPIDIVDIVLTYPNGTAHHINGSNTSPSFVPSYRLDINKTVTFANCIWNWKNYRDENITITVYTKQGYTPVSRTVETPPPIILKITELSFDLADTGHFLMDVTNMPSSLQNITITNTTFFDGTKTIQINQTTPTLPHEIQVGKTQTFNCTIDWSDYKGKNITITVYASQYNASYLFTLPIVTLNATFNSSISTQYFSLTIENNALSTIGITGISVNGTSINSTLTYPALPVTLENEETLVILCRFDWQTLSGSDVTISVMTSNGFEVEITIRVP